MPIGFHRVTRAAEPDPDAPPYTTFGDIGFADDSSHDGRWSLRFDLDGGSMAAALAPGEASAIPGCGYRIQGWVRTLGLHHARARVEAWYVDQSGAPAESTTSSHSELFNDTAGEWRMIEVTMPPAPAGAASIIIELQLLQPDRFAPPSSPFEPVFEDVRGSVWFDDFSIEHRPALTLATRSVSLTPDDPSSSERSLLTVAVQDVAGEPALVEVRIVDSGGTLVRQAQFESLTGRSLHRIELDGLPVGWYRAAALLRPQDDDASDAEDGNRDDDDASVDGDGNDPEVLATATLDFAILPHAAPPRE